MVDVERVRLVVSEQDHFALCLQRPDESTGLACPVGADRGYLRGQSPSAMAVRASTDALRASLEF